MVQVDRVEIQRSNLTIESRTNALLTLRGNGLSLTNSGDLVNFRPRLNLTGSNVIGLMGYRAFSMRAFGGSGSLTVQGAFPDELWLSGTGSTFTGSVKIDSGFVSLSRSSGSAIGSALTIGPSYLTYTPGFVYPRVRVRDDEQIPDNAPVTINPGAVLEVMGVTETIGELRLNDGDIKTLSNGMVRLTTNVFVKGDAEIHGVLSLGDGTRSFYTGSWMDSDTLDIKAAVTGYLGSGIRHEGGGNLILRGTNVYNGPTVLMDGSMGVHGPTAFSDFTVNSEAGLTASAPIGGLLLYGSLKVDGGFYGGYTERIVSCKQLLAAGGSVIHISISQPATNGGCDQIKVAGGIWLQSGRLSLGNFGYTPPPGQVFRIINNTGSNHIMGAFYGLPEGSYTQDSQHHVYRISYVGGDGNDVTLTAIAPQNVPVPILRSITRLPDGGIRIDGSGVPGMAYAVQKTLGFGEDSAWAQRAKIVASYNGTLTFTETNTVTWPIAFYRLTLPSYLF